VSFYGDNAYIMMDPVSVDSKYSMSMRLKATDNDGLIFYSSDDSPKQVRPWEYSALIYMVVHLYNYLLYNGCVSLRALSWLRVVGLVDWE